MRDGPGKALAFPLGKQLKRISHDACCQKIFLVPHPCSWSSPLLLSSSRGMDLAISLFPGLLSDKLMLK
jgi:hypothetical protein